MHRSLQGLPTTDIKNKKQKKTLATFGLYGGEKTLSGILFNTVIIPYIFTNSKSAQTCKGKNIKSYTGPTTQLR